MVMEMLGPSLEEVFSACHRRFSVMTTCLLGLQMLERVETIHHHGYLHRDIKPDNFLIGPPGTSRQNHVYAIDFGLAKRYRDSLGNHVPYREGKSLTGTARYVSTNTHLGIEQARRDDLEGLAYVFLYFVKGQLPWQGLKANGKKEKYQKIMQKKLDTDIVALCAGAPKEFEYFLRDVRHLKFSDVPDYKKLSGRLIRAAWPKLEVVSELPSAFDSCLYDWYAHRHGRQLDPQRKRQGTGTKQGGGAGDKPTTTMQAEPHGLGKASNVFSDQERALLQLLQQTPSGRGLHPSPRTSIKECERRHDTKQKGIPALSEKPAKADCDKRRCRTSSQGPAPVKINGTVLTTTRRHDVGTTTRLHLPDSTTTGARRSYRHRHADATPRAPPPPPLAHPTHSAPKSQLPNDSVVAVANRSDHPRRRKLLKDVEGHVGIHKDSQPLKHRTQRHLSVSAMTKPQTSDSRKPTFATPTAAAPQRQGAYRKHSGEGRSHKPLKDSTGGGLARPATMTVSRERDTREPVRNIVSRRQTVTAHPANGLALGRAVERSVTCTALQASAKKVEPTSTLNRTHKGTGFRMLSEKPKVPNKATTPQTKLQSHEPRSSTMHTRCRDVAQRLHYSSNTRTTDLASSDSKQGDRYYHKHRLQADVVYDPAEEKDPLSRKKCTTALMDVHAARKTPAAKPKAVIVAEMRVPLELGKKQHQQAATCQRLSHNVVPGDDDVEDDDMWRLSQQELYRSCASVYRVRLEHNSTEKSTSLTRVRPKIPSPDVSAVVGASALDPWSKPLYESSRPTTKSKHTPQVQNDAASGKKSVAVPELLSRPANPTKLSVTGPSTGPSFQRQGPSTACVVKPDVGQEANLKVALSAERKPYSLKRTHSVAGPTGVLAEKGRAVISLGFPPSGIHQPQTPQQPLTGRRSGWSVTTLPRHAEEGRQIQPPATARLHHEQLPSAPSYLSSATRHPGTLSRLQQPGDPSVVAMTTTKVPIQLTPLQANVDAVEPPVSPPWFSFPPSHLSVSSGPRHVQRCESHRQSSCHR